MADAVPLPSRAFDSLVYLVEHRDRLVGKNRLIDAVWSDVIVTDDSLIHAISVMRRALGDDPNEPLCADRTATRLRFVRQLRGRASYGGTRRRSDTDANSVAASGAEPPSNGR
jgi:DNA-binding response OmpR family regulator